MTNQTNTPINSAQRETSDPVLRPPAAIRALFLDIDGTLVGSDDRISDRVRRAIHSARRRGCEVVLCTGRTRYRTEPIADQLDPPRGYAITSNGGVLMHLGTREVIYRRLLPIPVAVTIVQAIREAGVEPFVYEDSDTPGAEGARVLHHPETVIEPHLLSDARYRAHAEIERDLPFHPVSVSAYGSPAVMRPLAARLRERLVEDVSIVQSGTEHDWGVEVYVSGISKRTGLEALAARLDVAREEVMAIGDHINDVEMIEWAGWGVAMGNAIPETKRVADWITAPLAEDGAAIAIERFVL